MEKLLLEACLEAMRTGAVVAIQDMGAAGLTSSSCEMASRGGVGIEIDLARVPQRETGMTPYEMMLSESQERMLLVAERGREREVFAVFEQVGTRRRRNRPRHRGRHAARAASRAESPPKFPRTRSPRKARSTSAPLPSLRAAAATSRRSSSNSRAKARTSPRISAACSPRRRSRRNTGSPSSTTRWCARTRASARARATPPWCA